MTHPAVEIRNVTKSFGSTQAVRDFDLELPPGSLAGFLGPNGAGKSTTIRMIMSIIYPDSGSIRVLGSNALRNKDRMGYLPEERGLYRKMRVGEYLEYIARLKRVPPHEAKKRIASWLERIDLPHVQRKRCEELSKGMQQKVQFLAAIIHDPDLIILDEPFSGLDPVNVQLLNRIIRALHEQGKTILFSTHVLHQAEQICDRFVLIHHGQKLLDATLAEIRSRFDPRTIVAEPLNGMPDCKSIDGVASVHRIPDSTRYEVDLADDADAQRIMGQIVARGPIRSIELRRLTLEEVFIRLVFQDEGEAAAERARAELSHV